MRIKPELKTLKEVKEKVELNQYLILSRLLPQCKPSKRKEKIIEEALKEKKWASEKELLKTLKNDFYYFLKIFAIKTKAFCA